MYSERSLFSWVKTQSMNRVNVMSKMKLNRSVFITLRKALCITLVICMLIISTPAAPKVLADSVAVWKQQLVLFVKLNNWISKAAGILFESRPTETLQETQEERDATVARIEIENGDNQIVQGAIVPLVAVPFDQTGIPVSGVRFDWEIINPAGQLQTHNDGAFKPESIGTYVITARGAGKEANARLEVVAPGSGIKTPSQTQDLLPGDEWNPDNIPYAHHPRNERGNTPGKPKENSNFNIAAPIMSLPGRGMNLDLGLTYNSRVWSKLGQDVSYDLDRDWVAPGWSMGFGKVINLVTGGIVQVDADGTRRFFSGSSTISGSNVVFEGQSTDGGFIKTKTDTSAINLQTGICYYNPSTYIKYPNGVTIWYSRWSRPNSSGCFTPASAITMAPKTITDRNGNRIDIVYYDEPASTDPQGRWINYIIDTLGRVYTFNYTLVSGRYLLSDITGPGLQDSNGNVVPRTFVRFGYKDHTITYNFSSLTPHVREATVKVLSAIYYPESQSGYWFGNSDSYSPYGMIRKVQEQKGMSYSAQNGITAGQTTRQRTYSYPTDILSALNDIPTFGTQTETWEGMTTSAPVTSYSINWDASPRTTTVTGPDQSKVIEYSFNNTSLPDVDPEKTKDGLTFKSEFYDANNQLVAKDEVDWEVGTLTQTNYTVKTPRPSRVYHSEYENGITLTSSVIYDTYGEYNQVLQMREIGYGGATDVLRKTVSAFTKMGDTSSNDDEWRALPRLINLPTQVDIYDNNDVRLSFAKLEYDLNQLQTFGGVAPPNFCTDSYCSAITQRGNVSKSTIYENATNLTGPISDNRIYDKAGNLVLSSDESTGTIQRKYKYSNQTAYAYPEEFTYGDVNSVNSQNLKITTSSVHDINTGFLLSMTDADLQTALFSYDVQTWRPTRSTTPTGAYALYSYDDAARAYAQTEFDVNGVAKSKDVSRINGLGLTYRTEVLTDVTTVGGQPQENFVVVETEYDQVGRAKRVSNPFRSDTSQHGVYWSETFYDARGREWKNVSPDGSIKQTYFNEASRPQGASTEPGRTFRMVDSVGRQKWYRINVENNVAEVVEPNPAGDGSVTANGLLTKYIYDRLGQLIRTEQDTQQRTFRYDSLGRLTHQKMAEARATLGDNGAFLGDGNGQWSDVYTYDSVSNITSHTDARGVKTTFSYINPSFPQLPVDPLNRIFSISYNTNGITDVLASPTVDYVYLSTGAVSKLKSVTTQGVSTVEFDFDTYARIKERKTTLVSRPSNPMIVNYTYDTLGRLADVVYPTPHGISGAARKTVHADYDIAGRINSVKVNDVAYASEFVFNSFNQLASIKIGPSGSNQINETYDYNLQTGLLQNQKVLRAGTALLDLSYVYQQCSCSTGGSGQIKQIINNVDRNKDRQYDYDAIGRLKKVIGGINQTWSQTYSYDRFGNRTGVASTGFEALRNPAGQVARSGEQDKILAETLQNSAPPTSKQLLEDVKALGKPGYSREAATSPISLYKESDRAQSSSESDTSSQQSSFQPEISKGEATSFNPPPIRTPFDFDGDHHADFSVWQRSNGNWTVLQSGNNQYKYEQFGASGDQVAPADYDGDGKTDIAVWRPSTGVWYYMRSSDNVFIAVQWGALGDAIVPADYDGDGKADIAVWRPSTSYWYILRSTDGGYSATPFGGQQYGDIPVAADYDGDGKADIAVWRPSNGAWYMIRSSDGQFVYPFHGTNGDVPVKADYDGDGKADLAVWRPSNNFWYIARSSDNGAVSVNWGTTGDVTVPADYDGDNKADIAVFRPSTGMWYVLRSLDGGVTSQQLGSSGHVAVPSAYVRRSSAPKGQSVEIPRDGLATVSYDATSNRITTSGFTYDYSGNQTRIVREDGTALRFQYDAAGRLAKVKNDSNQTITTYTYGISRERLITQQGDENSTNRTYYAWEGGAVIAEYTDSAQNTLLWTKNYIYVRGALLATLEQTANGERVQFDHPDQLGTRVITESGTTTSFEQTTLPFGTALNSESTGATNSRFTSYDRSATTNLDYAVNRFYDSTQGRFTQVDPIRMNSASQLNPQSLNLYAYCTNDPVNHSDPQGLTGGWIFSLPWPPWGFPPPSGSTSGASFWAWLSSFLHGFTGNVFNFGIPGYFLPPTSQLTFVSLSQTYGLPQRGTTTQITAQAPSQAQIEFDAAAKATTDILTAKGPNPCADFFGGVGVDALNAIIARVHRTGGLDFRGIVGSSTIGIEMNVPPDFVAKDMPIPDGNYFAVAPIIVTINMFGPFVLRLPRLRGDHLPSFGGYPPGLLQSRVLQLLHEIGHLTITGLGFKITTTGKGKTLKVNLIRTLHHLLPLDGKKDQKGLSERNTDRVLEKCRAQIDALR